MLCCPRSQGGRHLALDLSRVVAFSRLWLHWPGWASSAGDGKRSTRRSVSVFERAFGRCYLAKYRPGINSSACLAVATGLVGPGGHHER